jgi:oligopeptide/dipeptide ABC transporter ATP-binding protein
MGTVLSVSDLRKIYEVRKTPFSVRKELVRAVDGVSFEVAQGENLGLVGESGCGKSTVARCVTLLEKPEGGSILFLGHDWVGMPEKKRKALRKEMQIIFQDPYSSLNPRKRIMDTVAEPLITHHMVEKGAVAEKVIEVLKSVGLDEDFLKKYPHEMSGGQRQRVAVGRALATSPAFIIADEPVSSLDVSIQAQIINLFLDIKERFTLSMLFISHDLNIVRYVSDKIMVMYRGRVVEAAEKEELFLRPMHPYTKILIEASAEAATDKSKQPAPEVSCVFLDRCPEKIAKCSEGPPELKGTPDHRVACFLF